MYAYEASLWNLFYLWFIIQFFKLNLFYYKKYVSNARIKIQLKSLIYCLLKGHLSKIIRDHHARSKLFYSFFHLNIKDAKNYILQSIKFTLYTIMLTILLSTDFLDLSIQVRIGSKAYFTKTNLGF